MRVKVCSRCPYTPRDLADHYDPDGILHACAKCDGEHGARMPRLRSLCDVRSAHQSELPARFGTHFLPCDHDCYATHCKNRRPASRRSSHSIMSTSAFGDETARSGKGHYDENS